ncbi:hypothetical protein H4R20_004858 [Coemansia guatemalensis]|uniref:MARVEL domain-containing protein n=1 Tax=Coemansia guatemalensis TaxID=2761395 RepID=A0A9W8LRP6_9FUNG|nr:hypothetical protein H4R20_004858 [Coemansia guatemalensis]
MSYQERTNAYDDPAGTSYLDNVADSGGAGNLDNSGAQRTAMPSVDITSMNQQPYQPYAGAYSESAWGVNGKQVNRQSTTTTKGTSLDNNGVPSKFQTTVSTTEKPMSADSGKYKSGGGGVVGVKEMSSWNATRFVVYVFIRLLQLVVAIVCIGFQADSRNKRPDNSVDTVERNTEIAVFALGGITAGTATISIILHMFAKTRQRIEKSRLAWFTMVFNFAIFVTWIILVLINVIAVDCSKKNDGAWCRSIKASLATGLISAMFSLVVTLRSMSVLVRANRIKMWSSKQYA